MPVIRDTRPNPFACVRLPPFQEEGAGSPGLPCNHIVKHAMVSDPGEASIALPFAVMLMLTSTTLKVSSFSSRHLRGSIPSTFQLTACLFAVLRLKADVAISLPRTRYPVAGLPSGTGYLPLDHTTLPGRTSVVSPEFHMRS